MKTTIINNKVNDLKRPPNNIPTLIDAAAILTLSAIIVYVAGWWWLYNFMKGFNLHQVVLDIPKEYYFVYAFRVFKTYFYCLIPLIAVICGVCVYVLTRLDGSLSLPVIWIILATGVLVFYYLSEQAALDYFDKIVADKFRHYPKVFVQLDNKEVKNVAQLHIEDLSAGHYRLLLQGKERILLFRSLSVEDKEKPGFEVLDISSASVSALRFNVPEVAPDQLGKNPSP